MSGYFFRLRSDDVTTRKHSRAEITQEAEEEFTMMSRQSSISQVQLQGGGKQLSVMNSAAGLL